MRMSTEAMASFARGMNDSASATAYRADECALLMNGRVSPEGTARVRAGSRRAHVVALNAGAQGYGGTEFTTTAGAVQWIVFVGNKAFRSTDEGATWAEIATALRTDYWSFTVLPIGGVTTLICANGGASVYTWDGTTWATLAGVPAGVRYVASYGRRLWIAGHNGIVLQASEIDVPGDFNTVQGALYLQVQAGEGNAITGLFELGSRLLVFKRGSVATVDGFGSDDLQVQAGATGLSRSVGCIAPRTIQAVGDDGVMWLSERGLEYYASGSGMRQMATSLRAFFEGVGWGNIAANPGTPCALYLPELNEYRCSLPTYSARNDRTVRVNLSTGAVSLDRHAPRAGGTLYVDQTGALAFEAEPTRYEARVVNGVLVLAMDGRGGAFVGLNAAGEIELLESRHDNAVLFTADRGEDVSQPVQIGYDGFVRYLEDGTTDDAHPDGTAGRPIGFRLVTRPLLFGSPFLRKRARLLKLSAEAAGTATVNVAVRGDGAHGRPHALAIPAAVDRQPRQAKARVASRGRTLQVEVWTSDAVSLAGISLQAEMLREVGA